MDRFGEALRARDVDALLEMLEEAVRIYTPVLEEPLTGKGAAARIFGVLFDELGPIELEESFSSTDRELTVFHAELGGVPAEFVSLRHRGESGRIAEITAFVRPLPALETLAAAMAGREPVTAG